MWEIGTCTQALVPQATPFTNFTVVKEVIITDLAISLVIRNRSGMSGSRRGINPSLQLGLPTEIKGMHAALRNYQTGIH